MITTATDCGKEAYEKKRTVVYVMGQFSNTNDTMYVGDTLTLTITIPDSSFKINELPPYDTTWVKIESFENKTGGYGLFKIDSLQPNGIDWNSDYVDNYIIEGELGNVIFSKSYPYTHKVKLVLKLPGSYFFQSSYDLIPKINGIYGSMIIEWDVPHKNFEILWTWGEERYKSAKAGDEVDAKNYFPFVVLER
ncbi:MAG: hypothetical protein IT216_12655 [Saprospiraceae bacterium]|nr:MAG: hypothetical protein UZ08_BCD001000995 [Candidatus Parvibacillus calidus]MCC7150063.1 hypothetical protein [Saprospiraceae bacterium]MCO6462172.1 hypothetical protein [Saprospiraceae bacterium]